MSSKYSAAKIGQYAQNAYTQTLMNMKASDVQDPEKLKSDETTGRTVSIEKKFTLTIRKKLRWYSECTCWI